MKAIKTNIIKLVKKIINPLNIEIVKYSNTDLSRRVKLLNHFKVTKVLDVGANIGQYSKSIRRGGFNGDIISFEPLSEAYELLCKAASKDENWKTYNYGLGNKEEIVTINVSENLWSSSILEMTNQHKENDPKSAYMYNEEININTLNNIYNDIVLENEIVFLKLDVQGFEKNVIEGACYVLKKIKGIQLEMSLVELYKGEMLFFDMVELLESYGFKLFSLENGFHNTKTGQLLQVDGIFFRE